jgi:tRNA A37 threonylcarbamoyladenosine dehydratase
MAPEFGGIARLYGNEAVCTLQKTHITIVGLGGVGSWAAEAFVRSGIGHLSLIDLDDICITNTNRQLHALQSTVGQLKVDVMKARLLSIYPKVFIDAKADFINEHNLSELITKKTHYVLDAIDNAKIKSSLIAYCKRQKIKILTIGGAGGLIDPSKVMCKDLNKTTQDPLSARVRQHLRKRFHFSQNPKTHYSIPCIYSSEQCRYPSSTGEITYQKPSLAQPIKLDCAKGLGASMMVTSTFSMFAVARIMHYLLSKE